MDIEEMAAVIENKDEEVFYLDRLHYPKEKSIKFIELAFKTLFVNKLIRDIKRIVFIIVGGSEVYNKLSKNFYIEIFRALGMKVDSEQVEFKPPTKDLVSDQFLPLSEYTFPDLIDEYSEFKTDILLDDDEMNVREKILRSHLPLTRECTREFACLQYVKLILLPWFKKITVGRQNSTTYTDFDDMNRDLRKGILRRRCLKAAVSSALNKILQPVREHMASHTVRKITYWLDNRGSMTLLKLNWEERGIFSEFQKQTKLACWCYAIIDYLEAKYFKDHRRRITLSRQELIDNLGLEKHKGMAYAYSVRRALEWIEVNGLSLEKYYSHYTGFKQTPIPKRQLVPILRIKGVQTIYENINSILEDQPVIGRIVLHEDEEINPRDMTPYAIYCDKKLRGVGHALVLKGWDEWINPIPSYLVRDPSDILMKVKRGKFGCNELSALCHICICDWTYVDFCQKPGKLKGD